MTPDPLRNSRFLKACRREPTDMAPVWLMRQAGRYMQEYRDVRAKVGFKELCRRPELAAEVTVTAQRRIGADAAIIFSDILLLLETMGAKVTYEEGGPKIEGGVAEAGDLARLGPARGEELDFVFEAVRVTRAALPGDVPLIGFSGAPYTLASYLIEGESAREGTKTKAFMYREPRAWHELLDRLVNGLVELLRGQVEAGASAVQVFDSWVGVLSAADYREYVLPHSKRLFHALPPGVPAIHFGTGTSELLEPMRDAGASVIGIDSQTDLAKARARLGDVAVQGNLDPCVLLAPRDIIRDRARRVLEAGRGRPGHIFNLGHGVLPSTPVDHVVALIEAVHEFSRA